ncbi:MAG: bifunctional phosphopantothenoylcysteine decarboxylase/phosphopantothenate--cysteine ligase CoaBC [Acidobacteria bacterium]|nr:bifunctional phosphopantothenoylcysteine decarboxylase/phosphopantothenate--cysteine ligase CoaBC [Acidobacteriota bacterium]
MALIGLGVSGGISAYKAVEIARGLQQAGHEVVVIMTASAHQFVGRVTFEAITQRRVITDQFEPGANADIEHIALASDMAALVVAPATANIIGKLALGIADDFLTSLYLATRAPVIVAPAMNTNMFEHEAVVENLARLRGRGVHIVGPGEGYLACGWIGKGRLAEPADVVAATDAIVRPDATLTGRRLLVTAGPTYEDLDPVRYLGNRSSGRMGLAIAGEARRRGADVVLVLGPSTLEPPRGVEVVRVRSAAEMHAAVMTHASGADVVVMAAAVADYTVAGGAESQKIKKRTGDGGPGPEDDGALTLTLTRTDDILADLGRWRADRSRPVLVGFAAETEDLVASAAGKLERKRVDLIVANDVSRPDAGFEVETNVAVLMDAHGATELPLQSKTELAGVILGRIADRLASTDTAALA